jgi:hypothetical protein
MFSIALNFTDAKSKPTDSANVRRRIAENFSRVGMADILEDMGLSLVGCW